VLFSLTNKNSCFNPKHEKVAFNSIGVDESTLSQERSVFTIIERDKFPFFEGLLQYFSERRVY